MGTKMKLRVNVNEARRAEQRQQAEARRVQERLQMLKQWQEALLEDEEGGVGGVGRRFLARL